MIEQRKSFFYLLRESSAFFMIWLSLLLMYAVICAYTNQMGQDEFYRVIFFLKKPLVVAINMLALLMLLLHTVVWIKNLPITVSSLPKSMLICGSWAAIFSPIMMVIVGFIIPFGDAVTRSYLLRLMGDLSGKIVLLLMIVVPIWYALPRILQTIHDFDIHPKREKFLISLLALAWSAHAIYILFMR